MRFSFWPNPTQPYSDVLELAQHVERTGWDGFWYADHFMPNAEDTSATVAGGLDNAHRRCRDGATSANWGAGDWQYVPPSGGAGQNGGNAGPHFQLAGWCWDLAPAGRRNEHAAYGIPFYTLSERLARLDEACQVIKATVQRAERVVRRAVLPADRRAAGTQTPFRDPLPLLIGGGGEKVTLKITAKHADEWNVWGTVDILRHKMEISERTLRRYRPGPQKHSAQRCGVAVHERR